MNNIKPNITVPQTSKDEWKSCPFCGGIAEHYKTAAGGYAVRCGGKDVMCPAWGNARCYGSKQKAIVAWNKRSSGILESSKKLINGVPVEMIIHE